VAASKPPNRRVARDRLMESLQQDLIALFGADGGCQPAGQPGQNIIFFHGGYVDNLVSQFATQICFINYNMDF
jgi:hypothetical protein